MKQRLSLPRPSAIGRHVMPFSGVWWDCGRSYRSFLSARPHHRTAHANGFTLSLSRAPHQTSDQQRADPPPPRLELDGQVAPSGFRAGASDLLLTGANANDVAGAAHAALNLDRQRSGTATHIQYHLARVKVSERNKGC